MSQAPSLPFFVDAYLADTTHLTTEEHGAYLLLLMAMWRRGGSVPDDDADNARVVRLTPRRWRQVKERLAPLLVLGDGEIRQKRLQKEWDFVQNRRNAASQNGRLGGRPSSNKNSDLEKAGGFSSLKRDESPQSHTQRKIPDASASSSETGVPDRQASSRKRLSYPAAFEAFWSAYPTDSLMSKKQAAEAWSRLPLEAREVATASLPAFKAYCQNHPDYRPVHAVRYLSQERFVGFSETAAKVSQLVFVAKGSGEWEAWQRVKRTASARSDAHQKDGWWFPSRWPPETRQQGEAA